MAWYRYLALTTLLVCLMSLSFHFVRLIRMGAQKDNSRPRGNLKAAITYSFLGAMSPVKKESACLHLPTYTAGLLYHAGTFASIVLFAMFFFGVKPDGIVLWFLAGLLSISGLCGVGILAKRVALRKLRSLSNPDDYVSNVLVTILQIFSLCMLMTESFSAVYFLWVSLLLLYLPLGKLKHALYFFAARYHLGRFYGWRGIWPAPKS